MLRISHHAALWRHARDLHHECGPYQLRAALNAYGKDDEPEELYRSRLHRYVDESLPWSMPTILRWYGVRARWHWRPRRSFKKQVLAALTRDVPVLFVVRSIRGAGRLHWLSAWGYDEATDEFLIYDSQAPATESTPGESPPVGNTRYSAATLLSHLPWYGAFTLTIEGQMH